MYEELKQKVKDICKQNYKNNCGQCPLRPQCCRNVGAGIEAHNRWVNELNIEAEQISL
ncbi:hypothetical protein [Halalkalibacter oceani]|uniref:hypothetical protein n=1 Tax=Halalkalibacter oceani TaxID=1653776 RepID=UPI0033943F1D